MAEAHVSSVVELLGSIMVRELEQEVRLVVGVEEEVEKLTSNLAAIQAVIADAETKQLKEATVRDWLEKLKDVAYDIEDVLDDWKAAILSSQNKPGDEQDPTTGTKVCSFLRSSCFCCKQLRLRHDIANKIKELNESLDRIAQEKERYNFVPREGNPTIERHMTTSIIDVIDVKGREEDKSVLINMLLSDGDRPDLHILSMVGMGGIGKTSLAQFVFNHNSVETYFDMKIWVCVSDPFDEIRVAEAILESLLDCTPNVRQLQGLLKEIRKSTEGKKFLLVLDDVWEEDPKKWDQLKQSLSYGSPGSKVLVTTRKENVASIMGCSKHDILNVGILPDEECWLIVSKIAFFERSEIECKNLEKIGREISKKCKGLPLAAKTLGGILRFRKTGEEWQSILGSEVWKLEEAQREVFAPLWLSYYDLSPTLKRCFSYCAIFPKDYKIKKRTLIELWMAQGYLNQRQSHDLEIIGEYYFQNLAMRSLFQDFVKDEDNDQSIYSCKMHDMVHDLAQIVARNECHCAQVGDSKDLIKKVHHLYLPQWESCHNASGSLKKKRSLLLYSPPTTEELSSLFGKLTHVRSLSLQGNYIAEIPSSIGKLVRLRWLDLSNKGELRQLPETLCELYNLQTINVNYCRNLKLPLGIGKLIDLRHLYNIEGAIRLPKGVAQLTCLRTLERIDVGCDGDDAFSLGDLKNLNQLRGRLFIYNLGEYHRHVDEAKQVELKKKEHITQLQLQFSRREDKEEAEHLLGALEPSPNLALLSIVNYKGTIFPSWMISLMNLRGIKLSKCQSCEHLPSLGKLPYLETLFLDEMEGVKKVGVELLGIETPQIGEGKSEISASSAVAAAASSSSSSAVIVAFPKLTNLHFSGMGRWEEWDDYYHNDGTTKPPATIIMPSLCSLEIRYCWELKALPNYILQNTMLHTLVIIGCNILEERYNKEKGEDWSKISHISNFRSFYSDASIAYVSHHMSTSSSLQEELH